MSSNNPKDPIVNLTLQVVYIHYYHQIFFKNYPNNFTITLLRSIIKLALKGGKKTIQKEGKYLTYEGKTTHKLFG